MSLKKCSVRCFVEFVYVYTISSSHHIIYENYTIPYGIQPHIHPILSHTHMLNAYTITCTHTHIVRNDELIGKRTHSFYRCLAPANIYCRNVPLCSHSIWLKGGKKSVYFPFVSFPFSLSCSLSIQMSTHSTHISYIRMHKAGRRQCPLLFCFVI